MSLALVHSRGLLGLQAPPVRVEVHLANGLPAFTLVGLADTEVKEARERVRSALLNSGLSFPANRRITVSLAPADLPKESGRYDLPIALGILAADGQLDPAALARHTYAGELSLAGDLQPVRGALPMALAMRDDARPSLVLPRTSAAEAALAEGVTVHGADHLLDVVAALRPAPADEASAVPTGWHRALPAPPGARPVGLDLADVRGQAGARRALEIAAAGGHSLLMSGPPGSGKSMLAQRLASLLPPLPADEALEVAAIASLAGGFEPARWGQRPTRAPHHSASAVALVGGGSPPKPGEISLAHHGVLFLDELPEFQRTALEALREPLESGAITISRAAMRAQFPARFQLVAAMNPCPCGHLGSPLQACCCAPTQVARYRQRLSGPLLDRIDLHVDVAALPPEQLMQAAPAEASAEVARRVAAARERALARQGCANHRLEGDALLRHAAADTAASQLLQQAARRLGWSARGLHRSLRVARTIADLAGQRDVGLTAMAEAIGLRPSGLPALSGPLP